MTAEPTAALPISETPDDIDFWSEFAQHRLAFQRCTACGAVRHPPIPACPWCASTEWNPATSTGHGHVYSWVRVHVPFREEFRAEVPYTIVTVTMDEGCRMFGRLEFEIGEGDLIGAEVEARFVDHSTWTECRFALTARGSMA